MMSKMEEDVAIILETQTRILDTIKYLLERIERLENEVFNE